MTHYPSPPERLVALPLMTPDEADRLLDLLETVVQALRHRVDEWHEDQLDLPIDAALDVACPPSEAQLARDAADAERLSAADFDPRT